MAERIPVHHNQRPTRVHGGSVGDDRPQGATENAQYAGTSPAETRVAADQGGETMPEALDHILRSSLPWRDEGLTECGRSAHDVASSITLDELKTRIQQYGKQRTAFTVCITCWNTADHAAQWDTNPIGVIGREAQRCGHMYVIDRSNKPEAKRFAAELRAIAALVEAHRDEFDNYIAGLAETSDLVARRRQRRAQ